jgi:hypothetical protein
VFIHQELSLAKELTVAENIYLGELPARASVWSTGNAFRQDQRDPAKLKVGFDARTRVGDLSIANQQMVEIARALTGDAKAVIFDEPTASLTDAEKGRAVRRDRGPQGAGRRHHLHLAPDGRDLQDHRSDLRSARRSVPRHARTPPRPTRTTSPR